MGNCGLKDLRLVAPREGWPNSKAATAATAAAKIVEEAQVFDRLEDAIADLQVTWATSARGRDLLKETQTPEQAARHLLDAVEQRSGFIFGPERTGLENEEISLATRLLHVPLNPELRSLNLGQAVLLVCWEYRRVVLLESPAEDTSQRVVPGDALRRIPLASGEQLVNLFEHFEGALEHSGFFRVEHKRTSTVRNLRALLQRAELREHEVRTLHGVLSALTGRRKDGVLVGERKVDPDQKVEK